MTDTADKMGIGVNIKTTGNQITKLEFDIWEFHYNGMTARTTNLGYTVNTQTIVHICVSKFANVLGFLWVRRNPCDDSCCSSTYHPVILLIYIQRISQKLRTDCPTTSGAKRPAPRKYKIDGSRYG